MTKPGYREHYNVNPKLEANNLLDENDNPTGGGVRLILPPAMSESDEVLKIEWQSKPRKQEGTDELLPPNGALQRLEFFNEGKYRDRANSIAITHLEQALQALKDRQVARSYRGVEGEHKV